MVGCSVVGVGVSPPWCIGDMPTINALEITRYWSIFVALKEGSVVLWGDR
eukprot:GDKH01011270.1.p2 GENE.GDKH01011270.1~~GDKH01011270.1.p2  ORF type:complete len:50 (+),score=3.64 GDKH01011270.1:67-216(+)